MARRARIPWLVDVVRIDDAALIDILDADPRIDRDVAPKGPWLNQVILERMARVLAIDGVPLPAFRPRDDETRARARDALETRLNRIGVETLTADPDVEQLGKWVRGGVGGSPGPYVQSIVGRLFKDDYHADFRSYEAARVVDSYLRAGPVRGLVSRLSGKIVRAFRLLRERADDNPHAIHATCVAMHNIERALVEMRGLIADPARSSRLNADTIVQQCLKAPEAALRTVREPTQLDSFPYPIRPGTLIAFQLAEVADNSAETGRAFRAGSWAQCPAHDYVPRLLRAIYLAATKKDH